MVFAEPGTAGPTPLEMLELWRELIDLHDRVKADLGESPTDAEIYAAMTRTQWGQIHTYY